MLSAQALSKRYGSASGEAVRGASLELRPGEYVSIVGRSGSGKSSFLAMLGALTKPTGGCVRIDGTDLWTMAESELARFRSRHIGFVFQFPSLLSDLTALDNVALPAVLSDSMEAEEAYRRAYRLLAQVGVADRADAVPGELSGGEQRRVAIARALINSPPLLFADEPTSDLDQDSEAEIIELLEELQRSEGFGFVLVTHDLRLAAHAQRRYEMRQGVLTAVEAPQRAIPATAPQPPVASKLPAQADPAIPAPARAPIRLGADFRSMLQVLLLGAAAVAAALVLADFAIAKYQEARLQERGARLAELSEMALSRLQSEIQSIVDLGDGGYELAVVLRNAVDDRPIYVMSPEMRAFVQVGKLWQELPLQAIDEDAGGVLKIEGKHSFRYRFDARVSGFAQLLPNYMHVRFSDLMLVSPSSVATDDVFERKDNYYVYLKPSDVADETVLKRVKFAGKPPVWIPMPPH